VHDLVEHRLLRVEVVVQAPGQDAGRIRDLADRRARVSLVGEDLGREREDLVASL
jgi:hypothetical protein